MLVNILSTEIKERAIILTVKTVGFLARMDKMEYENGNAADISVGIITPLRTYDDFRSPEGVNLMEQADIICANPPFFLFYEYVAQLTAYGFIINLLLSIGNLNAVKTEMSFLIFLMAVFGWVLLVLIVVQH